MTIQELEAILQRENIFQEFGIERLGLFGSFARGGDYRDIDILVEHDMHYKQRERLQARLQAVLHTKVDLVAKKFADPIILYRANKELKYVKRNSLLNNLLEDDTRVGARERIKDSMHQLSDKAARNGLTEEKLTEILAEIDQERI